MKTVHEFLVSKGIKSISEQIPALVVEQYIKEYCSDLLVFCAKNAKVEEVYIPHEFGGIHKEVGNVNKKSILKIKDLI